MSGAPVSPVGGRRPGLHVTYRTINIEPVELDGTATAFDSMKAKEAKSRIGQVQLPPNPLSNSTWDETNEATKQVCLRCHTDE